MSTDRNACPSDASCGRFHAAHPAMSLLTSCRFVCDRGGACWTLVLAVGLVSAAFAQVKSDKPDKSEMRELKRELQTDAGVGKPRKQGKQEAMSARPAEGDAEARSIARLREHLEVTDDSEWAVIAERIKAVVDSRMALGNGVPGTRLPAPGSEKAKRSSRSGAAMRADQDALRSALRDRLPDAEIKVRLTRAHEVFEANQFRLSKAQAELRAVLTVRQEAVVVLAGLLPP